MSKNANYINHICWVIDKSGSMSPLSKEVVQVFDAQIKHLARRSQEMNQETRVTVYLFNDVAECVIFDKDVLRLPSLAEFYRANGNTALIGSTIQALRELAETSTRYGDHSFLVFCQTDGENNVNNHLASKLNDHINALPENWTVAVLVPNQTAVYEAKRFGFPANNIQVWSAVEGGFEKAGETIRRATDNYMTARSTGLRGTKSLFTLDPSNLSKTAVKYNLEELSPREYELLPVRKDAPIKEYVEGWLGTYRLGSAYYQLTKPEIIQAGKQICVQNKQSGKVYGGLHARNLLGLPNHEIKVKPLDYGEWNLFCQSTSVNRKLIRGTNLIVLK